MKMRNKITFFVNAFCIAVSLLIVSCVDGFKENELFSSGVTDVQLQSPDTIFFTQNGSGSSVAISWPIVYGAGGYAVSFYKVDDPANPVLIGVKDQIVDKDTVMRFIEPDTKYKAYVRTLGNIQYNNTEALDSKIVYYSTLVPTTAVIPSGTELGKYFTDHPVPSSATELAYELEAGGTYTMTSAVNFGSTPVTFRGSKVNHPTVTMSAGFLSLGGGVKFKFVDFNCAAIPIASCFFGFGDIPSGSATTASAFVVTNPIVFQSCKFSSLPAPLYWDNGKNYAVQTLLIQDCIIQQTDNGYAIRNSSSSGAIKDFTITKSTVYKTNTGTDYWMQLSGQRFDNVWTSASQTYTNNTFYGFDRMHNSNNYARTGMTMYIQNNLFLNELRSGGSARYLLPSGNLNNKVLYYGNNTYVLSTGVVDTGSDVTNYDKSGTILNEDPKCISPATGNFTVTNANTIARKIGDPRWLP